MTTAPTLHKSRTIRAIYIVTGFACFGLGVIGIWTPLLPTTVFMLLAAYFWSKSSERWHTWLMNTRYGPFIEDYRAGRGIPRKVKIWAVAMIALTFTITTVFFIENWVIRSLLIALAVSIATFILTRPTTEKVLAAEMVAA